MTDMYRGLRLISWAGLPPGALEMNAIGNGVTIHFPDGTSRSFTDLEWRDFGEHRRERLDDEKGPQPEG